MGPSTPRKPKHRHYSSGGGGGGGGGSRLPARTPVAASDYESDAQLLGASAEQLPAQQVDEVKELNLKVIKRYVPTVQSYTERSYSCTVYLMNMETKEWVEPEVKGPMFVCVQEPADSTGGMVAQGCIFVLNRQGLENAIIDLNKVVEATHFDYQPGSRFLVVRSGVGTTEEMTYGLYMDADSVEASVEAVLALHQKIQGSMA